LKIVTADKSEVAFTSTLTITSHHSRRKLEDMLPILGLSAVEHLLSLLGR
jgi:hypothetical protein